MLDLARIKHGKFVQSHEVFDVRTVLNEVIDVNEYVASQQGVKLIVDLQNLELARYCIKSDPQRLQ